MNFTYIYSENLIMITFTIRFWWSFQIMKVVHCNENIVKFKSEQILLILECILRFEHEPPKTKTKKNKNKKNQKLLFMWIWLTITRHLQTIFTCITGIRHDVCTCRNRIFFADKENLVRKAIVANSSDYTAQCSLHAIITCEVSTNPKCSRI